MGSIRDDHGGENFMDIDFKFGHLCFLIVPESSFIILEEVGDDVH